MYCLTYLRSEALGHVSSPITSIKTSVTGQLDLTFTAWPVRLTRGITVFNGALSQIPQDENPARSKHLVGSHWQRSAVEFLIL